ncbi:protein GRAVITROPIC IN THE LIGHT 1-like [Papaver somniferum]|uniref:protein GRAVITROPIC IN THE LIGHT 1-like n=1 Tax=Papaver somniferum TaxID=3469 RepID=UPI000E6FAE2A|nr:protein GRAVITROPIC IN THE LIGHT 1-like [Papaver somniferum]
MDSNNVSGLVKNFTKVLRFRTTTNGVGSKERIKKSKFQDKPNKDSAFVVTGTQSFEDDKDEKVKIKASIEALLSKLFASISAIKASYAQIQISESPYDPDGIQSGDELVINELKNLSELKQSYSKKVIDSSPQVTMLLAEIQEQQSLLKTYDIMSKKYESQLKLQDSEITFLREKLEESDELNRSIEQRLNPKGPLSVLDNLHLDDLNPTRFITVLRHTIKSVRIFTKLMLEEMVTSGWDIDAAANSIQPGSVYLKSNHKCFAFESFVCRIMFDCFQYPNFALFKESLAEQKQQNLQFFQTFMDFKEQSPQEILRLNSTFRKFLRVKYLDVVHPKMEFSFFGDMNQRNLINSGRYPETKFFTKFLEMAKMVWLLHCLGFSFNPQASIFQTRKGCRFSEVFMGSVNLDESHSHLGNPRVSFTVVPGFKIGKTIIQCQVYLSVG